MGLDNAKRLILKKDKQVIRAVKKLPISILGQESFVLFWRGLKQAIDLTVRIPKSPEDYLYLKAHHLKNISLEEVRRLFKSFGLFFTEGMIQFPVFYIARTQSEADELKRLFEVENDELKFYERLGELSGFPQTAIKAYGEYLRMGRPTEGGPLLNIRTGVDVPKEILIQDSATFIQFRLSRDNWREELKTVQKWSDEIKQVDPQLHKKLVKALLPIR